MMYYIPNGKLRETCTLWGGGEIDMGAYTDDNRFVISNGI